VVLLLETQFRMTTMILELLGLATIFAGVTAQCENIA
jgi:hypothetical protein